MRYAAIGLLGGCLLSVAGFARGEPSAIAPTPAKAWPSPGGLVFLDVARAGNRLIAVGELGVILLSDDDGLTFRQAEFVPVDSTLTAVTFEDREHGWAVGQWGVIISTADGGEHWQLNRVDTSVDRPLFSIAFQDAREGWAVGLWSLLLHTRDGGHTWTTGHLNPPPGSKKADRNLYKIFLDDKKAIYIAAELGNVLRSTDGGVTWTYLATGYMGSFWTGMAAGNGAVFVGGLRGNLYRSLDGGNSWTALNSGSKASITGLSERSGMLVGVGLDGYVFAGPLDSTTFSARQRPDRLALTAVTANASGATVMASKKGIISNE